MVEGKPPAYRPPGAKILPKCAFYSNGAPCINDHTQMI
jgi:hypothetical protein